MSSSASREHRSRNLSPEYPLLGFLIAGPDHGYDLHLRFVGQLGQVWHLSQSQAYSTLKRLENRGDITARRIEQDNLPDRQLLRISPQGRRRFMDWLENGSASNARPIRLEFLTRLYFCNSYMPERMARIFAAQCAEIRSSIERLQSLLARLPDEQTYNRLSVDLRLRQLILIQEWMAETQSLFHIPVEATR